MRPLPNWDHMLARAGIAFGNISRLINRLLCGAQGQTLCARIAALWPDCWFCRAMSRLVEPLRH